MLIICKYTGYKYTNIHVRSYYTRLESTKEAEFPIVQRGERRFLCVPCLQLIKAHGTSRAAAVLLLHPFTMALYYLKGSTVSCRIAYYSCFSHIHLSADRGALSSFSKSHSEIQKRSPPLLAGQLQFTSIDVILDGPPRLDSPSKRDALQRETS